MKYYSTPYDASTKISFATTSMHYAEVLYDASTLEHYLTKFNSQISQMFGQNSSCEDRVPGAPEFFFIREPSAVQSAILFAWRSGHHRYRRRRTRRGAPRLPTRVPAGCSTNQLRRAVCSPTVTGDRAANRIGLKSGELAGDWSRQAAPASARRSLSKPGAWQRKTFVLFFVF